LAQTDGGTQQSRDVDGNGAVGPGDVLALADHLHQFAVADRDPHFDFDESGIVDENDVGALVERVHLLRQEQAGTEPTFDVDGDGVITVADILALADHVRQVPVSSRNAAFDFNESGSVDEGDIPTLVERLRLDAQRAAESGQSGGNGVPFTGGSSGSGHTAAAATLTSFSLVPHTPGPYAPGSSVDVDVVLTNLEGQAIQPRLITLDFSATDPALILPAVFEFQLVPPLVSDAMYARFQDMPKVDIVYFGLSPVPGFILDIPDAGSLTVGTMTVVLPSVPGTYSLDATNPSAPDLNTGARLDYGFDSRTTLHTTLGNLEGVPLILVVGSTCTIDTDCDDGLFCNGVEVCSTGTCIAGTPPCSDSIACTDDLCDETSDACSGSVPNDAACDDGNYCNGAEVCNPAAGCEGGIPIDCDDGVDCTVDVCDESTDMCVHEPDHLFCDDGVFCNGLWSCDPTVGCLPPTGETCPPGRFCDEDQNACLECLSDADCDDGDPCTGVEHCQADGTCAAFVAQDCNANGIHDDCETLPDLNSNGIPDACEISGFALVPRTPGPYQPGSSVDVDVVFTNREAQAILVRLMGLDFSASDSALALPEFFSFQLVPPLFSSAFYARFETMPKVDIVYTHTGPSGGYILDIPDGGSFTVGTLTVGLPSTGGSYFLDMMNAADPDTNHGARVDYGFAPRTTLHSVYENLLGDPLELVVTHACQTDADCDDGWACTIDTCDAAAPARGARRAAPGRGSRR